MPNPDKSRVKWFQHRITPEGEPWAFTTGDPQRAIAALELFGLLLLVRAVLLCAAGSASHTRILVASDNQGNVFPLLNDSTRRMPNAAILMEIVLTLHDHQVMLGPSHVKRDFNTWADELTHPDPQFPTENRVFPSVESELINSDLRYFPSSPMMPGGHPVRWEDSSLAVGVASILLPSAAEGSCPVELGNPPILALILMRRKG